MASYAAFDRSQNRARYSRLFTDPSALALFALKPNSKGEHWRRSEWQKGVTSKSEAERIARPYAAADEAILALPEPERERLKKMGGLPVAKTLAELLPALDVPLPERDLLANPVAPTLASTVVDVHPDFPHGRKYAATATLKNRVELHQGVVAKHGALRSEAEQAAAIVRKAEPTPEFAVANLFMIWRGSKPQGWNGREDGVKAACKSFAVFVGERTDYREVTNGQIKAWRNRMADQGAGYFTQRDNVKRLAMAFAAARVRDTSGRMPTNKTLFDSAGPINVAKPNRKKAKAEKQYTSAELRLVQSKAAEIKWGGGRKNRHEHAMWLLRLAPFGFRPKESSQTQRTDVFRKYGAVWVWVRAECASDGSTKHDEKSVKTADSSERCVPLHPSIGEAFYKFVQDNTTADSDFVFACFPFDPVKKTRGEWAAKKFCNLRRKCGLREGQTMYGMRGTYLTYLIKAGVDPDLARYITAHGDEDVHSRFYLNFSSKYDPAIAKMLVDAVGKANPLED